MECDHQLKFGHINDQNLSVGFSKLGQCKAYQVF